MFHKPLISQPKYKSIVILIWDSYTLSSSPQKVYTVRGSWCPSIIDEGILVTTSPLHFERGPFHSEWNHTTLIQNLWGLFIESSREIKAFSGYRIVDCIWIDPIESISAHLRVKPLIADRLVIDKLHLEPLVALGFYFSSYLHRLRQQADWFHSIYFNGRENSISGYRWSVWVSVWEITSWSSWLRKKLPVDL